MPSFGGSVKLTGESEYKKALASINQSLKEVDSELKLVTSQYDKNDKSEKALADQSEVLNKKYDMQGQKLKALNANYKALEKQQEANKAKHKSLGEELNNEIKKLTVLGKNVNLKKTDNKFFYSKKCKTTKPKIKMTLKKGWKIEYISAGAYKNGNYKKEVKVTKTMLKKGKAISFSKKYDNVYISVFMINSKGDRINYDISLYR